MRSTAERPPELSSRKFVLATIACLVEFAVCVLLISKMGWHSSNWQHGVVIAANLGVMVGTWRAVTGERLEELFILGPYRKLWQGSLYQKGFAAGRDGKRWDDLDSQSKESNEFVRGWQDGLCYRELKQTKDNA